MEEARVPSYWWCYKCRKEVTPEPGVALDLNLNSNPNPVCCLCQEGFLERIYASSSVAAGIGIGIGSGNPPQSRSSPYRALSLDNHDRDHNYSNEGEGEKAVDHLDCFSDEIDSTGHFLPDGRIVEEEEEQLWENQGVSENLYAASEGEVEPGTLLEGESFIGNVDPRDNDLDEAAKNSRNSDDTALADDGELVDSTSVDHSGSSPHPTTPSEMGDLMLAFHAWDPLKVEQWEEEQGEEAVTAASADDTAEVNFNFGSTKGIILPAAEEEEEEQVSYADWESVGSNSVDDSGSSPRSLALLEPSELAEEEDVDEEEDDEGDVIVLQHQHEHENFPENNDDFGARPASRAAVESLPSMRIGQEDFDPLLMCAICKGTLSVGELTIQLPCGHNSYHADCIRCWLRRRNSCPLCRYELPTDPAYEE